MFFSKQFEARIGNALWRGAKMAAMAGASHAVEAHKAKKKSIIVAMFLIFPPVFFISEGAFAMLFSKIGIPWHYCAFPSAIVAFYAVARYLRGGSAPSTTVSDRLKRSVMTGTEESSEAEVVEYLREEAQDAAKVHGMRQGRVGIAVRRTPGGQGDVVIPWGKFFAGVLLCGSSNAGKSSGILYPLLEEILSLKKVCMMLVDVKGDYSQILYKRELRDKYKASTTTDNSINHKVYLLNPADRDSIQFKLQIRTSQEATKLANIFIPYEKNEHEYFPKAARNVLAGLILGLQKMKSLTWKNLYSVIAIDNMELLQEVLNETTEGKFALSDLPLHAEGQLAGVLSSLKLGIKFLAPISQTWDNPTFDIKEFIHNADGVVILRYDKQNAELSGKMLQIFFELALCEIAPQEDYNDNTYIFFADELQNIPKLDLSYSTSFLRSKCLAHVLSHQDVNKMQYTYSKEEYNSIFENISTKIVLNAGTETAETFSKAFGNRQILQESRSNNTNFGQLSVGNSVQDSVSTEPTIIPGRIIGLPAAKNGVVTGFFKTAGCNVSEVTWSQNITNLKPLYKDFIEADWVRV